ncbi:MAG TPA: hypothetical protein VN428_26135 [Bryobacteraceae bacterium]|nr:hypothetical protein [Bryobacteraceae bacterium]
MERGTIKTRTIFIATRGKTALYHAIEDIPPGLRKKLVKSTTGVNSGTVLIADRRGLQELVRRGLRQRTSPKSRRTHTRIAIDFAVSHWPEIGLSGALAILLWLALFLR